MQLSKIPQSLRREVLAQMAAFNVAIQHGYLEETDVLVVSREGEIRWASVEPTDAFCGWRVSVNGSVEVLAPVH